MKTTKSKPSPSEQISRGERARLAAARDRLEQAELDDLNEPPKPIENEGSEGAALQKMIERYRQGLQMRLDAARREVAWRLTIRTVKEAIIDDIIAQQTSSKGRQALERLPVGDLHQYLPRFDWRNFAVVPRVRDQGACSSCWALTATEVFESNLMIKRANYPATDDSRPGAFFISQVGLNVHSTLDCVPPRGCMAGRYETAFNHYFKQGIPVNEITLNGLPLDRQAPAQQLPSKPEIDVALPKGHCRDKTNARVKILGWDYVYRGRKKWRIPPTKTMKRALLEHGPLAVGIPMVGLKEYGCQRLTDLSVEIGSNPDTGVAFKREKVTGGLLVSIPAKFVRKQFVPSLKLESFNLNLPAGGDARYQFMPAIASIFKKGKHRRAAKEDSDVRQLYQKTTDTFADFSQLSRRETEAFMLHFPASNAVKLERDRKTGKYSLSLPANSNTRIRKTRTGELTMVVPFRPSEDLDPVFQANADVPFNHYVLLIGWDDNKKAWIMQNSWGQDWGFNCRGGGDWGNGYAYVSYGTFGQFAAWVEAPLIEQGLTDILPEASAR